MPFTTRADIDQRVATRLFQLGMAVAALAALSASGACAFSAYRGWEMAQGHALHDPTPEMQNLGQLVVVLVLAVGHLGAILLRPDLMRSGFGRAAAWLFLAGIAAFSLAQIVSVWPAISLPELPRRYIDYKENDFRDLHRLLAAATGAAVTFFLAGWALFAAAAFRSRRVSAGQA